jgi:hypothetical protein
VKRSLPWLGLGVGALLALVVYQPWRSVPFDMLDFSEFLPLLANNRSLLARFQALIAYYSQDHGRFNIIPYGMLALKWSLFGWDPVTWQLLRFLQMSAIIGGTYYVLLQLRVSKVAAVLGALLFVTAGTATPAYLRLTMAEPLGTMFLLAASALALQYRRVKRWRLSALAVAGLLIATVLSKEMLVAAAPFVLLLGCCRRADLRFGPPRFDQRGIWLLAMATVGIALASIPIVWAALQVKPESFGGMYGRAGVSIQSVLGNWVSFSLVQAPVFLPEGNTSFIVTNFVFLSIIAIGWRELFRARRDRQHFVILLLIVLTLPGCAALIYSPWPQVQLFYGLPFLLGVSILFAQAVVGIETALPRGRWAAYIASGAVFAGTSASAYHIAQLVYADRAVKFNVARELLNYPREDSVLYGVQRIPLVRWEGQGPTLRRYMVAVFETDAVPPINDVTCRQLRALEQQARLGTVLASSSLRCGPFLHPSKVFKEEYQYLGWPIPRIHIDSVRSDLLVGTTPP